ncbi:hypothetical protein COU05_01600 [bacterium (Candidatus Gribaldobacteria) CG10_big_fil_rev_8_21_14_0_10_37_21]|uniref:Uncharacterized protein n=1 Tax=bacterium (Candidatus Gribaldobacteria) CG10_big_fil_rev_8_21_14_0_10_37_21 TaxID=2014275 RepID=A0A2H0UUN3_9BACT|nr:MAG: hypothetical protein AUJ25_00170 [Parcubacteria group bacterium CG1_02_37_13]PIR90527.1 MAG: hypothetical protein COU05_01600 [bacterium (Candidatus Gribaldobacteria) CG10_big_fil_rev_8_21_14_0_10_37_21]
MAERKNGRVFSGPEKILIDLYEMHFPSKVQLGNTILLNLKCSDGKKRPLPPTFYNLCMHLGLFQSIDVLIEEAKEKKVQIVPWQKYAMERYKIEQGLYRAVKRIRGALENEWSKEHPLWFYCLPKGEIFQKDEKTGQLVMGWDRTYVLSSLPMTAQDARERYNCSDGQLYQLLPQIIWLCLAFCSRNKIRNQEQAGLMLKGWEDLLDNPQLKELKGLASQRMQKSFTPHSLPLLL